MGARKVREDRARDMLYPERIYQEFEGDNATWWNFDPRVEWLMGYLTSHRSPESAGDLRQSGHCAATGAGTART